MPNDQRIQVVSRGVPLFKSFEHLFADLRIIRSKNEFLGSDASAGKKFRGEAWFRLIFQACITLILLGGGFYILLSKDFDETSKKIGSGFIGTAIGYWLR